MWSYNTILLLCALAQAEFDFNVAPEYNVKDIVSAELAELELEDKVECRFYIDEIFTFACHPNDKLIARDDIVSE